MDDDRNGLMISTFSVTGIL